MTATLAALLLSIIQLFISPLSLEEMQNKQAVIETTLGSFIIELLPEAAPNHVGYFIKTAEESSYNGTIFHRVVRYGIIQGGDPLTKNPQAQDTYGTGGLGVLAREPNDELHTRGAVSAVQIPGQPDSAGAQFFVVVTDQSSLDGQFTIFARVVEGISVVQKISEVPTDETGKVLERVEIKSVEIRDKPPAQPPPFADVPVRELASYRAVLETSLGEITIEFFPDKAPNHVRNFLRLSYLGAYDGTSFHRIVAGFVIQTGFLKTRGELPTESVMKYVINLEPEFNDTLHVEGVLSMARGDDPASASTSFFIVTGAASSLDGKYTAFGQVVNGQQIVNAINSVPTENEEPQSRIDLIRVRVEKLN